MQRKKLTLRFDLDNPEDKRAWEYLQSLNGASMNRTVLAIINQKEQTNRIQEIIRCTIQEELSNALNQFPFQPIPAEQIFRVIKCQFGYRKVRYRGLKKNENRLYAMFACVNLYILAMAGRRLREA